MDNMDDIEILSRIRSMVNTERELRSHVQDNADAREPVKAQLRQLEESLDQCWDLLRQRRARVEYGEDPDETTAVRPIRQVENYLE